MNGRWPGTSISNVIASSGRNPPATSENLVPAGPVVGVTVKDPCRVGTDPPNNLCRIPQPCNVTNARQAATMATPTRRLMTTCPSCPKSRTRWRRRESQATTRIICGASRFIGKPRRTIVSGARSTVRHPSVSCCGGHLDGRLQWWTHARKAVRVVNRAARPEQSAPLTGARPFWITPGGSVDPQEDLSAAAARELWEETGQPLRGLGAGRTSGRLSERLGVQGAVHRALEKVTGSDVRPRRTRRRGALCGRRATRRHPAEARTSRSLAANAAGSLPGDHWLAANPP